MRENLKIQSISCFCKEQQQKDTKTPYLCFSLKLFLENKKIKFGNPKYLLKNCLQQKRDTKMVNLNS